jgi:Icc protein
MPVHLPPISRRDFLKRSLLTGAGLALAPELFAARWRSDENSWVLMADTHIAADPEQVARGINMTAHFRAATREVFALPRRPAGVFILGDCAFNSGETGDYATFAELLDPLRARGLPLHLALGNHDQRQHFAAVLEPKKKMQSPVRGRNVALLRTREVNWFVLDSLERTLQTPGALGDAQLDWLARTLDAHPDKPALVLVHHQPDDQENVSGLKDTGRLWEIIRPRNQVKAWIFGHTHRWNVRVDESGIHLVNLPPVAYVFQPANPFGWVHATVRGDGMNLELRCLDATHKDHGQTVVLKWRAA